MKRLFLVTNLLLISAKLVFCATQLKQDYSQEKDISQEFKNVFLTMQPKNFTIFKTTPTLNQLQDGQIVLVSTTNKGISWRDGNTVNFLTSSGTLYQNNFVTNVFSTNIYTSNFITNITSNSYNLGSLWEPNASGNWQPIDSSLTSVDPIWELNANNNLEPK